jgi:hypothetical protein
LWRNRHKIPTNPRRIFGMAEIRTVTTFRSKRAETLGSLALYEKRLEQARADLAHLTTCIAIFEASAKGEELSGEQWPELELPGYPPGARRTIPRLR